MNETAVADSLCPVGLGTVARRRPRGAAAAAATDPRPWAVCCFAASGARCVLNEWRLA